MAAAGLLLALPAAALGSAGARASLFGPFAGYVWQGEVHQVSAVIDVPRVRGGRLNAIAASWIGAEGPPSSRQHAANAFVQIGVNEVRRPSAAGGLDYAFWSSVAQGFHPRPLFRVAPGDTVRVTMSRRGRDWLIAASDETTGRTRTLSVASGGPLFNQAIWQQEDPTNPRTAGLVPYPSLSPASFGALEVNYARPRMRSLQTTWMSTGHRTFGPTRVRGGAFTVRRVYPSAEALEYQRIALSIDLPQAAFGTRLAGWSARTPERAIRRACLWFAHALGANSARLRTYHWSADVRAPIGRVIQATDLLRVTVMRLAAQGFTYLPETFRVLRSSRVHQLSSQVRRRLHIPFSDPSEASVARYLRVHAGELG